MSLGTFAACDDEAIMAWAYFADRPWCGGPSWLQDRAAAREVALDALKVRWLLMLGEPTECDPLPRQTMSSCTGAP